MVTTIYDYVDEILKEFPYLSKKEIESILFRGFRIFDDLGKNRLAVNIYSRKTTPNTLMYMGALWDPHVNSDLYTSLVLKKGRYLSRLSRCKFDGYYYFGITDTDLLKVLAQGDTKTFGRIMLFRTHVIAKQYDFDHLWRIPHEEGKDLITVENLVSDLAECVDGKIL